MYQHVLCDTQIEELKKTLKVVASDRDSLITEMLQEREKANALVQQMQERDV